MLQVRLVLPCDPMGLRWWGGDIDGGADVDSGPGEVKPTTGHLHATLMTTTDKQQQPTNIQRKHQRKAFAFQHWLQNNKNISNNMNRKVKL